MDNAGQPPMRTRTPRFCSACGTAATGPFCVECGSAHSTPQTDLSSPVPQTVVLTASRTSRILFNSIMALVLCTSLISGVVWVGGNWECRWRTGENPLYGLPESSQMIDVTGDGIIDAGDFRAINYLEVRQAVHMRNLYDFDEGWSCMRQWL